MRVLVALAVLAAAWTLPTETQAQQKQKIQCWTDKTGARMCGDRIPPEYAGEKREIIQDGRVVGTVRAMKTPEEIAEEKRRVKAEEDKVRAAEYDRALLESYRTSADITASRNERLVLIDSRIQAAEKNAADTDKALIGLRARAEAQQQKNEPVDDKLAKQIRQFEKAQERSTKALERYRHERQALWEKLDRDFMRYNELRGLPVTPPPPPPGATASATADAKVTSDKPAPDAKPAATPAPATSPPPKAGG